MAGPAPRKFTMADLMILIAGCAGGIVWTQAAHPDLIAPLRGYDPGLWFEIPRLILSPSPTLASIGLALLACQLRPPRPGRRRLARRPGFVAIAAAAGFLAVEGVMILGGRGLKLAVEQAWPPAPSPTIPHNHPSFVRSLAYAAGGTGPIVAACWLALWATGRWKPEPAWIDRAGRLLGACWIAVYVALELADAVIY